MTTVAAGLITVLALGYPAVFWLVLRHLKDRDALERDERARDARERDTIQVRHAQQIADLLQRIQAPELAVIKHQMEGLEPGDTLPLSDRESAEAHQARMTDEEIAEQQLAIERMERLERDGMLGEVIR